MNKLGQRSLEVDAAELAVLLANNPAMREYEPISPPVALTDSGSNLWDGTFSATTATYTFRPQDNSSKWPATAKAVIIFINGQWSSASGSNAMSVRAAGASVNELQVRAYVANIGIVAQGRVQLDSNGYFEVVIGGATNSNGLVRLLGYIR